MDISKAYPNPVNIESLMQTVRASYQASQGDDGFRVHNIAPENEASVSAALDLIIHQHNPATLTTEQQQRQTDSGERATLLQQADNALTQITNDLAAIAQGKTAATNATTLAQMRTVILGMLDVMEHTCTRQDREIRVLRAIVRNGLDDT